MEYQESPEVAHLVNGDSEAASLHIRKIGRGYFHHTRADNCAFLRVSSHWLYVDSQAQL
jgi:hypothetical protein